MVLPVFYTLLTDHWGRMAGRGRGRGIAAFTFNIEALGLSRGALPETALGPIPLFPPVEYKPVPLKSGEDEEYMLALKQEIRATMKNLPYNIPVPEEKPDVERYKEKYTQKVYKNKHNTWTPDWQRLPKELMPQKKKKTKPKVTKQVKATSKKEKEDLLSKLDELEKKDQKSDDETGEKAADEGEDEEGGEGVEGGEFDEEEAEEENDYIASYFEDGDDFGGGSDDNMDEATY
ncbi:DNA-directed RNA polymerase III subunit RPC7 [Paramormyrops kingsleyae]|uniref:RNA polymerase III subunit G n=1 Tax=Paramormyrops kingsleyae TaxID=1676925 RepID=A0A3B3SQY8_9TELE|nr:DNA-directed RNA polymerase III subunit RPC7 isoform X2 [Paramormyrops kingsleyae]